MKSSISFLFVCCFIALSIGTQAQYITENIPLPNSNVMSIALGQKDNIYIGTNLKGVFQSDEHNINWKHLGLENFRIFDMCFDSNHHLFTSAFNYSTGGIYTYQNNSWQKKHPNSHFIALSIKSSPFANTIFTTGPNGSNPDSCFFILSHNTGETWEATQYYDESVEQIQDYAFQSIDTIYAASVYWVMQDSGGVYRSTDGGHHWELFGLEGCDVQNLHIHNNYLYAAVRTTYSTIYSSDGIYRYHLNKKEATWELVYPHRAFGVASDSQGRLYGASLQNNYKMGIVVSEDGCTWHQMNGGPQHLYSASLYYKIDVSPNDMIYFLAYSINSASLYRARPFDGIIDNTNAATWQVLKAFPNPCTNSTTFQINNKMQQKLSVSIYNLMGQQISQPAAIYTQSNDYSYTLNTKGLAPGMYICCFTDGKRIISHKLIKQ